MSDTTRAGRQVHWRSAVPHILFVVLAVAEVVRTLHHAMWRDELQAFMIAANSPNVIDLFQNLKYEGHPGLWHLLLWIVARFSTDPVWMQVTHIVIALSTWMLIYRYAPFTTVAKFLLFASYFLSWEYFVISRNYALMALLGFAYVALRMHRPQHLFLPWLILGLLANTVVFGAIWSMAMAAFSFFQSRWRAWPFLFGAAIYAALLALAVLTMSRSGDEALFPSSPHFDLWALDRLILYPLHAFAPGFPTGPIAQLLQIDGRHFIRFALLLAAPTVICWAVTRDIVRTMEFAATSAGVSIFALLWHFPGDYRHHGILFLAFVGAVWGSRTTLASVRGASRLWLAILLINAAGGIKALSFELRPFSQGRQAANWIERNHLGDGLTIGSRDFAASTVAGYLRRPIYYLDCECRGTFVVWNTRRRPIVDHDDFLGRIARAIHSSGRNDAILVLNRELAGQEAAATPSLAFEMLSKFTGARNSDENFFIYRVQLH